MKLKVVLLTRSGRPSGALMAYRLINAGYNPLILVENRGKLLRQKVSGPGAWFSRCLAPFVLVRRHGLSFLWNRVAELLMIKTHYSARRILGAHFKSPAYLSIEELALTFPLRLQEVSSHNGVDTQKLLREENPDVGILTNTRKIKAPVLASAQHGFFNVHSSSLPKYAGLDAIFWALYHGEKEIGVTVHEAVPQIDQGCIATSAQFVVTEWDTEASLARKATWVGTALMTEVLEKIESGTLELTPQPIAGASYFSWPTREQRGELRKRRYSCKSVRSDKGDNLTTSITITTGVPLAPTTSSPRILHIITRMTRGGAQENTLATIRGLEQKGYQTVLVTGPSWGPEGEILSKALREGHQVVLLPELGREVDFIKDPVAFLKLFWLIRWGHFDLVHTHMSKGGLIGRLAAFLAGAPVIVHTPHGHIFHSYFSRATERFFLFLERRLARVTDRLIALTDSELREHMDFYVGAKSQWNVIPSGVDETLFYQPSAGSMLELRSKLKISAGAMVVGFVGRLEPIKGPIFFIQATPEILKNVPKTHFVLVGNGQEREMLEAKVRALGVESSVTFAGDQRNISDFIAIFDVQVVPSLNEGMGRVIVEAGFMEKPVVASNVGGIPDLILDGKTGLFVQPKDSAAIAQAVLRILNDTLLALKLGKNLRAHVLAGFTESQMVEKIDKVYRRVLDGSESSASDVQLLDSLSKHEVS